MGCLGGMDYAMIIGFLVTDEALVMGAEEKVIGLGTLYRQRYR